jgi:hypothetical protein
LAHLTAGNRWSQFTGRKIVTVAYDECCDDPDDVCSEWPEECEFIVQRNVPALQEVASFAPMLERIESNDPDEFTTYVHCKGATQPEGHPSHLWCDAMAAANLDYPELIECAMQRAHICGAFRSHGLWTFPGYHGYHFAGTWFTFRHSRIFGELDWLNIHPTFFGVEAWPGIVPKAESFCLFFDQGHTAHLYDNGYWRDNITPSLKYWRKSLEDEGLHPIGTEQPLIAETADVG